MTNSQEHKTLEKISAGRRGSGNAAVLLNRLEKFRVTAEEVEITGLEEVLLRLLRSSEELSFREKVQGLLRRWRSGDRGGVKDQLRSTASPGGSEEDGVLADPEPTAVKRRSASLDSARSKCVQLLLAALLPDPPEQEQAAELAGAIEEHIHQLHKPNQLRYKTCVRSKVANLRNPKNPHLRRGLLSGSLLPQAFARMSAEEMAGPELRRLREEICRRGVNERQLPRPEEGTPTRGVRCRRCGGSDCRVTQVSRGDAMTFVTCSVCGQQWYHSRWSCL
uniref:Transcription elongation factor A N-terminal and central domain containing n=1 Tax=Oryzias sinensis TaxID=183150 RepID=A0A8C7YKF1_9TELE